MRVTLTLGKHVSSSWGLRGDWLVLGFYLRFLSLAALSWPQTSLRQTKDPASDQTRLSWRRQISDTCCESDMPHVALTNSPLEIVTAFLPDTFRNTLRENSMLYFSVCFKSIFWCSIYICAPEYWPGWLTLCFGSVPSSYSRGPTYIPLCIFISVAWTPWGRDSLVYSQPSIGHINRSLN